MTENVVPIQSDSSTQDGPSKGTSGAISDHEFGKALDRLKRIAAYLVQLDTGFPQTTLDAARLGALNTLKEVYPRAGREATREEWEEVESRTQVIWSAFSNLQRRQFLATEIPGWFSYLIVVLLFVASVSIFWAFLLKANAVQPILGNLLGPFMVWIMALGTIGACASIAMNVLSVQDDVTFDLSNKKFLWLRLVLGALFGTVLALPLGFDGFQSFLGALIPSKSEVTPTAALKQASFLLLPFVLGFSTSLVILVLNRLIEGVQTFFGKTSSQESRASAGALKR